MLYLSEKSFRCQNISDRLEGLSTEFCEHEMSQLCNDKKKKKNNAGSISLKLKAWFYF